MLVIQRFMLSPKFRIVRGSDYSPAIAPSEDKDIYRDITLFKNMLAHKNCIDLKILSKSKILTYSKGRNYWKFAKITFCNNKTDLDNENVYTKFGLIPFIWCQDIEQKPIFILTPLKGPYSSANVNNGLLQPQSSSDQILSMIMCIEKLEASSHHENMSV